MADSLSPITDFLALPLEEMANLSLSDEEWRRLGGVALQMARHLAAVASYADWRGGAGCGDHGHDKAAKAALKTYHTFGK